MHPDIHHTEELFRQALDELTPGRADLIDGFNRMVEVYNGNTWKYGPVIAWLISNKIEDIRAAVERLVEVVNHALDHYTPVLSLFRASVRWTEQVMTPTSEIYGSIPPGVGNRSLHDWDDRVRKVYDDIVSEQQDAVGTVRDNAKEISSWLSDIGKANVNFAVTVLEGVAAVVKELVQAAVELASVVGAPFAIQDAASLIGTIVEEVMKILGEIGRSVVDAVDRVINAEHTLSDRSHFPGGGWPHAVSRADS